MTDQIDHTWSAGVGVDEPGYPKAAAKLLVRWIETQPAVPANVKGAAAYLLGYIGHLEQRAAAYLKGPEKN